MFLFWGEYTKARAIPGIEELKPYINKKDKIVKRTRGIVGFAIFAAILSAIMTIALK